MVAASLFRADDEIIISNNNSNNVQGFYGSMAIDKVGEMTGDTSLQSPLLPELLLTKSKDRDDLIKDETTKMIKLAIPCIGTYLLEMLPGVVTVMLVGRLKSSDDDSSPDAISKQQLHLDAAALAVMFTNVIALAPALGLLTALDTLCSQAHGANKSSKMGRYSLTGFAVTFALFLLASPVLYNTTPVLIALGQPLEVCQMAGIFIRYLIPGLPFLYLYESIRKISQSRNEAMPMLVSQLICNVINLSLGYYLVHFTKLGWIGAAIARSVGSVSLVPTLLMGMVMGLGEDSSENAKDIKRHDDIESESQQNVDDKEFLQHIWEGFVAKEALSPTAIKEFLLLGFPGMLQSVFAWVAFEVIALLCGILPGDEAIIGIGANAVVLYVGNMTYMLYFGVGVSGNVRIGNALGAGDAHRAEVASFLTLGAGAAMAMINIAFLLTFRKSLPRLFTSDPDIIQKAQHLFLIVALFQLPDSINGAVQGIFRGSGRQALAAKWNFAAYYCIGLPLGYLLGVKLGFGVEGLWLGITSGLLTIAISCTIIIFRT
eukprot:CAMPEP_0201949718 /NCGR_PEP_ID=MMETSP0903-20130614/56114_1 /ASSEMBLY_ACC=CAM_ASM_000552 /TAXON_ID=420261 /ORGANISM="Thalassiosira antarctica, Strain CCMP982" /LENGTH=543 /DNA_ID=CAMNT_0048492927 /DNA_START=95 /DNA_END=1723 /DNA_ORIENTATION=+